MISKADVGKNPDRAHNAVNPGKNSPKNKSGEFLYEDVLALPLYPPGRSSRQTAAP